MTYVNDILLVLITRPCHMELKVFFPIQKCSPSPTPIVKDVELNPTLVVKDDKLNQSQSQVK